MGRSIVNQTLQLLRRNYRLRRPLSTRSGHLFEIEINSSTASESETLMLNKLDDIVQRILVQKATPDWLPFSPGSSFWVPPRHGVHKFVGKLADKLSDEESLAVATDRGWPCSDYLINGSESVRRKEVDEDADGSEVELMEVNVNVLTTNLED